jgi:predicted CXXCH cytochrome family protein
MKLIRNLLHDRYGSLLFVLYGLVIILPENIAAKESVKMLTETTQHEVQQMEKQFQNPHWQSNGCSACHDGKATRNNLKLHVSDINALCNSCHATISNHSYIHPYGMTPSKKIMKNMPASFLKAVKRGGGKLTCITCHDLPKTCLSEKKSEQGLNPRFFREGPYETRTELCYRCHDKNKYKRLNPHDQVDTQGKLKTKLCTVCHVSTEKLKTAKSITDVDFNYEGDLSSMCIGCHPVKPHPGGSFSFFSDQKGPNHLVKPPQDILQHKIKMEKTNEIIFPLEPGSGKVFCGTCHNPHAEGVIKEKAAAKGAGSKKRLRMQKICRNCHNK